MLGEILGITDDQNKDTEVLFANYAKTTVVLVRSDFTGTNKKEAIEHLEKALKESKLDFTYDEYEDEIVGLSEVFKRISLEQLPDRMEEYFFQYEESDNPGQVYQNHIEKLIAAQRRRIARLLALIDRVNHLYEACSVDIQIDGKAVLADLQDYYMHFSPRDKQSLTENIWLSNRIFSTRYGIEEWNSRLDTSKRATKFFEKIPQSLFDITAGLRKLFISSSQEEIDRIDHALLGEAVAISLDLIFSLSFQANIALFCQGKVLDLDSKSIQRQWLDVLGSFTRIMLSTPRELPGAIKNDKAEPVQMIEIVSEAIASKDQTEQTKIRESEQQYAQYLTDLEPKRSIRESLPVSEDQEKVEIESEFYASLPAKVSLPVSIANLQEEIATRKSLRTKREEAKDLRKKLKETSTAYEKDLYMLKNYPAVFLDSTRAYNTAVAAHPELKTKTAVLTGATVAATAATVASWDKGKEDNSHLGGVLAGLGLIASSAALSSAEDELKKVEQTIKKSTETIERSSYIVQYPKEIDSLSSSLAEIEAKTEALNQEEEKLNETLDKQKNTSKKGKIFFGAIFAILVAIAIALTIGAAIDNSSKYGSSASYGSSSSSSSTQASKSGSVSSSSKSISNTTSSSSKSYNSPTASSKASEYILSKSNSEYYSESDLGKLTDYELFLARNEIYARHGREFNSQELKDYFKEKSWYSPRYSPETFDAAVTLNQYEKKNAETILSLEKRRGSSYVN